MLAAPPQPPPPPPRPTQPPRPPQPYTNQHEGSQNASFTSCENRKPAAPWAFVIAPAGALARPSIFWNGPSNASTRRSNLTPIVKASVHPALSYGRTGGPPG